MADSPLAESGQGPWFLFYRFWPGFNPSFPYERVSQLEGKELLRALDALVHEQQAVMKEKLARLIEERRAQMGELATPVSEAAKAQVTEPDAEPERLTDHKRALAFRGFGWMYGPHVGVDGMATPKRWLCEITEEERAQHVQVVLEKRFSGKGDNPRFGIAAARSFDKATQAVIRLEMDDAARQLDMHHPSNTLEAEILHVILRLGVEPEQVTSSSATLDSKETSPQVLDEIPELDGSSAWVSVRMARKLTTLAAGTLRNYRLEGEKSAEGLKGIDPGGRIWRKANRNAQAKYLRSSL